MKIAIEPALHLLHRASFSTLAGQSLHHPGYPYATVVPGIVDERHCPLLLISALAEHTRNLLADPKVSLSVVAPGCPDVQAAPRLTLIGDAERLAPEPALQRRYLRYLPAAAQYLELDFIFFRVVPKRLRFIAGVGRMGWLEADEWAALPTIDPAAEEQLLGALTDHLPSGIRLLGLDRFGLDVEYRGQRQRLCFDTVPGDDQELLLTAGQLLATWAPANE